MTDFESPNISEALAGEESPLLAGDSRQAKTAVRLRMLIRFTKRDDLRWLSHRDLMRLWERLFRRARASIPSRG
jgi:hypothetical protein